MRGKQPTERQPRAMRQAQPHFSALHFSAFILLFLFLLCPLRAADAPVQADVKSVSLNGELNDDKARLVIEAQLNGLRPGREKLIFATALQHSLRASLDKLSHSFRLQIDVIQGEPKEFPLVLSGDGEVRQVTGEGLQDWSVRQEAGGARLLVLRPKKSDKPITNLVVAVTAETEWKELPRTVSPLTLVSTQPALFQGYARVDYAAELDLQIPNPAGVAPIELKFLPEEMRAPVKPTEPEPLAFRFQGAGYALPLKLALADPEARQIVLSNYKLTGQFINNAASFTLTATARVRHPKGGSLELLSGGAALTDLTEGPDWRAKFEQGRFVLKFDKPGDFPLQLKFNAAVKLSNGWNTLDFRLAPSALQPVVFQGLAADTQFKFAVAARPERSGNDFLSYLPPNGQVQIAWKEAKREVEGRLFYSVEMLSYISVSPGLMTQWASLDCAVMQGEMTRLTVLLHGQGEVTRVQGRQVLSWKVEPVPNSTDRRLTVLFNQPQKDRAELQISLQSTLGAFPLAFDPAQTRPEGATRFAGKLCVANGGAVRLEVVQASGLSQVSPDQFPTFDGAEAARAVASQRFVYRFSSAEYQLRVQADNVLPEVAVSELLDYHLGETELAVEGEMELDIREAPLRELVLRVPKGFAIARLTASNLSDQSLKEEPGQPDASLRLIYGQPVSGRQVIQFRLERNKALGETNWILPRVEVVKAKSTRGHIGVSADPGFRLTPGATENLTEIANAFFPKKVTGMQAAFRLTEAIWLATLRVERLPQSIQADVFHLFSIGEGIAYGSSVLNYLISGAPISVFRLELSSEYFNVEFTGKDIRAWQKTEKGFEIQLHSPVSGAFTLLATYERPFKAKGETLTFAGARPLGVQSEQGHTIVISAYQFEVKPVTVSSNLLALEPGEVPSEYRLFFDAPILAAYRYNARPFNLDLQLSPLAQGETIPQVADRASLLTRISKEGQIITDARYFVKNRGTPHFRCALPEGTQLWSATVNGAAVVPVTDDKGNLIPLPQRADPNAVNLVELKLASRSKNPNHVTVAAPIVAAPVMLAEWKLTPDTGQRLEYTRGSLTPAGGILDVSGFAALSEIFSGDGSGKLWLKVLLALGLLVVAVLLWRATAREGTYRYSARQLSGGAAGLVALIGAGVILFNLAHQADEALPEMPRGVTFLAPVQQVGSALSVEVANLPAEPSVLSRAVRAWPAWLTVLLWIYALATSRAWFRPVGLMLGWTCLGWAALRSPYGAPVFFLLALAFLVLQIGLPALWRLGKLPRKPLQGPAAAGSPTAAAAAALLLLAGLPGSIGHASAQTTTPGSTLARKEPALAESVVQQIRVEDKFALATLKVRWPALKGQSLPLLYEPAVVTQITYPTNALKLVQSTPDSKRAQLLVAQENGTFDLQVQYQVQVTKSEADTWFVLPTQFGLVNRVTLTLADLDVDVVCPQAISIQRESTAAGQGTVATLVLPPVNEVSIGWRPRSRDTKHEKAVFYAELVQLYVPSAGVIEGTHLAAIRPAQGEISELLFSIPTGATITDVIDPNTLVKAAEGKPEKTPASVVSFWRFDPDTRWLRVGLNPPMAGPFNLLIKSQVATGPLPIEQSVGLVALTNAADQLGLVGVATGPEVQLDSVTNAFTPIYLEDFSPGLVRQLQSQTPGLTLRRAYRYTNPQGLTVLKASPVEPEVRVEAQQTLSLGEDRLVLAATLNAAITRAGLFHLSFVMPPGFDVESIASPAMSHWTDLKAPEGRIITMHLKMKTEGQQQFTITLTAQGLRSATNWSVPRLTLREASKQQGQLIIVPEQGLKLTANALEGVTPLDPQKSGIRQKGVLAFHVLQNQWNLALDMEQVPPWIQVTSLQHVTVNEALMKIAANLQYQIENTGLKSLRVRLPVDADGVQFKGDQLADFRKRDLPAGADMQDWDIKLNRRIIGAYLLQVTYQVATAAQTRQTDIRGVQADGVNLQRGFLTVQSGGRLQVRTGALPAALQPTEWQSIPRALRQDLQTAPAHYTFRLVEPGFTLPLQVERREAAKLLPARVNNITLTSVISDEGVMLTQARLEMIPGDKRLLQVNLPPQAHFWFAFVNQNGVWPWLAQDGFLIPLEQASKTGQAIVVELFYSSQIGSPRSDALNLELAGPKFDLPLEDITWRVFLNEKWELKHWSGSLQLSEDKTVAQPQAVDLNAYLQNEASLNQEKTKEAEGWLQKGNSLLEKGDPQQARQAFQAAYGLSQHDSAFNEDARVQLHNLKMQQALVGLNVRQLAVAGDAAGAAGGKLRDLRNRKAPAYTQDEAKQIIERNPAEDNAALMRLAERLIQQQESAVSSPSAIRAAVPEQGRLLSFKRAVQVDPMADLKLHLEASAVRGASLAGKLLLLTGLFVVLLLVGWLAKGPRRN